MTSSYSLLVLHHSSSALLLRHKLRTLSHSLVYSLALQRLVSQTHLKRWWISAQRQKQSAGLEHGRDCLKELHYQSQCTGETSPAGLWFSETNSWKKSHSLFCLPAMLSASSLLGMYIKPLIIQSRKLNWSSIQCFFAGLVFCCMDPLICLTVAPKSTRDSTRDVLETQKGKQVGERFQRQLGILLA